MSLELISAKIGIEELFMNSEINPDLLNQKPKYLRTVDKNMMKSYMVKYNKK
jgi:hypothetical protein